MLLLNRPSPGFVAKTSVQRMWIIGFIADNVLNSLFLDRAEKTSRAAVMQQLKDRQQEAIDGKRSPLVIFPEGATTNGTGLIHFKKGAFASLLPV